MLEVLKVPMNLTIWVLVASESANLAVQLCIHLKSEISVVFGFLKAPVHELPQETFELRTGTLREVDSLAPIYWEFVLTQLDKGVPVERIGMASVRDDPDEQHCMGSMADVDAKPKANPKRKASKPKHKKGAASNPPCVDAGGSTKPQATPTKRAPSSCEQTPAHGDEEPTQQVSQQLVTPQKGNTQPLFKSKGQSPSLKGFSIFANSAIHGVKKNRNYYPPAAHIVPRVSPFNPQWSTLVNQPKQASEFKELTPKDKLISPLKGSCSVQGTLCETVH